LLTIYKWPNAKQSLACIGTTKLELGNERETMENEIIFPLTDEELAELFGCPEGTIKSKRCTLIKKGFLEQGKHYDFRRKAKIVNRRYHNYVYTELGAIEIAHKVMTNKANKFLIERGVDHNKGVRIEHSYIDFIVKILEGIAKCERQYKVEVSGIPGSFKVDLYLPEYGIVIECDEIYHEENKYKIRDMIRQAVIESDKGYEFIRFSPEEKDFDFNSVLNQILKKIINHLKIKVGF
jgi:very-short-patch-repair endonuclease